jgi:type I restriction enzyme M protein
MPEIDKWIELRDFQITLDGRGKIIDFLDPEKRRENLPEERIRQKMGHILHYELGYPKNLIAFEKSINIGRERKSADIVIYNSNDAATNNDQGNIFIIAETKAPSIINPDGQLVSYVSASSAQGAFWTNGNRILFYRKDISTGTIVDYIGIPKFGHAWDSIGKYKKNDLITPVDLKLAFRRCHNAIYRTGIDSEDVALDMVRIILSKIEDESSSKEECDFHITPDEYKDMPLRKIACKRVRDLFTSVRDRYKDVFSIHEEISASDDQLALVISQLQQYSFLDATHDVIGTAYEIYVASHLKGERGQYFTNRLVVDMMVDMVAPMEKDIILDPACGSGGFLVSAMNYIFNKINISSRTNNAKEILKRNVVHQLFGVDISPKLVKIAKANMLLGKDGHGGIEHGNSLNKIEKLTAHFNELCGKGKPSIILTNPPFGSGYELRIKEKNILSQYKCGRSWDIDSARNVVIGDILNDKVGVAPEILFLEKCIEWIKINGIIAIVMAKGQLDNKEAYMMRNLICKKTQIIAIVNLHEDTFEPFCGSKASVIFLKKVKNPLADYRIFMAISNKVGQTSRGEPILKKDTEGNPLIINGQHVLDEDLSDISADFIRFKDGILRESEFRFSVAFSELKMDSLSLNPVQYLPQYNATLKRILEIGDSDAFKLYRLGEIGRIFNGPRFKRPYATFGITKGPTIRKYFTGTALTQLNSDNVKYLDSKNVSRQTQKYLEVLTIFKGYILISDSGTLGRVTYALSQHDGHVATNNLIRVVIEDEYLRGYVYEFLRSEFGQSLMLKNRYGTNQEHLEPDVIEDILIPIPKDKSIIKRIGKSVMESIINLEKSIQFEKNANNMINSLLVLNDE